MPHCTEYLSASLGATLSQFVSASTTEARSWKERRGRWCIFTSAGDNNSIRSWFEGGEPRKWELIVAYYGNNESEFLELRKASTYAFRTKGGKFQNLKKFVAKQPIFFERYSYIWVCDDDIRMSVTQINEAFAITELLGFWIAQPAFDPRGKNSHPLTIYAESQCDYRIVNFIEVGVPIFRQDKLADFLQCYDGSLTGHGIDFWYMNFFGANKLGLVRNLFANLFRPGELGRFAIIDKVQVINPHAEEKGGREIDRLQSPELRRAAWAEVRAKYRLVEFPPTEFVCRKMSDRKPVSVVTRYDVAKLIAAALVPKLANLKVSCVNALLRFHRGLLGTLSRLHRFPPSASTAKPVESRVLVERLGYLPGQRLLIVHADDLAIAHSVNAAIIKGLGTGLINSASVMVPCPWFPEVATFAREHPEADLGIHLTLTSERTACRWGPTVPRTKVPSLVDGQGYFHQTWTHETKISAREVEIELRAQIERAFSLGLRPTHLDSHQSRLHKSGRSLFEIYLRLGREYNLPIVIARDWFAKFPYLQCSLTPRDVVIDRTVTIDDEIQPQEWSTYYRRAIESLQPGITQFVIHPGLDTAELQAFSRERQSWGAAWRQRDFDFFTSLDFHGRTLT